MNVPVPTDQEEWLKAQVAAGRFASLEDAIAIDDAWAKPLIDEALEALDRGEGTPWRKGEGLEKIVQK